MQHPEAYDACYQVAGKSRPCCFEYAHIYLAAGDIKKTLERIPCALSSKFASIAAEGNLQTTGIDPYLTVAETIELYRAYYADPIPVDEAIQVVGLVEKRDTRVSKLSGGQQRRLDVAIALAGNPRLLFLDEPTTGLDPEVRADMWTEISRLASDQGLTILLTTHYLEEADNLASQLAIVDRGSVVAEGTPEGLKADLRGDAIHVELAQAEGNGRVSGALEELGGIREVSVDGRTLHARADDGARAVPVVLQALSTILTVSRAKRVVGFILI